MGHDWAHWNRQKDFDRLSQQGCPRAFRDAWVQHEHLLAFDDEHRWSEDEEHRSSIYIIWTEAQRLIKMTWAFIEAHGDEANPPEPAEPKKGEQEPQRCFKAGWPIIVRDVQRALTRYTGEYPGFRAADLVLRDMQMEVAQACHTALTVLSGGYDYASDSWTRSRNWT